MASLTARLALAPKSNKFVTYLSALLLTTVVAAVQPRGAFSLGLIGAHPIRTVHGHLVVSNGKHVSGKGFTDIRTLRSTAGAEKDARHHHAKSGRKVLAKKQKDAKKAKVALYFPQKFENALKARTIAPGVVYKSFKGPLVINVLDVDTRYAPVHIRPILASDSFDSLKDVGQQAKSNHALAAVNANYFKKNGTPLGTLIVDGEWVAGPLYDRVSLGVTKGGFVRVDRVKLAGSLETSNAEAPSIWINNINQPRRTGSRLVAYTRRWGSSVRLPYEGCLVAINADGEVYDKSIQYMAIPASGYVLTDSKDGPLSHLVIGDAVKLSWRPDPANWTDVVQAVSGGPLLIKDGKLFVDLKDESFRAGWTGCQIKARTAAGVTGNHHLILVTVEGPHTLWDLAKFLSHLGVIDALNLDGGGSTAMFVNGETVTRSKRRVASAIGIFPDKVVSESERRRHTFSLPQSSDLSDFTRTDLNAQTAVALQTPGSPINSNQTSFIHPPSPATKPVLPLRLKELNAKRCTESLTVVHNGATAINTAASAPAPGR